MTAYIIPLTCLLMTVMASLTCLRFILSREGLYWVIPCLISIILTFENMDTLLIAAETSIMPDYRTLRGISPVLIAFLWYMMIIVFHYALKKTITENRFENDSIKNRAEAEYLEKYEARMRRKSRKAREEKSGNSASVPSVPEYRTPQDD